MQTAANTKNKNGFKATEMVQIPEDWEVMSLGEIAEARKEAILPTQVSGPIYVGLEHIDPGNVKIKRHGHPKEVKSSKFKFYKGDILFGKLRPYLEKVAIAGFDGICSTDIIVIRTKPGTNAFFLVNRMHSKDFISYVTSTMTGVNHPRTSWSAMSRFRVGLPSSLEQRIIAFILFKIQQAIEQQDKIIETTRSLKKSLMQKLFIEGMGHTEFKDSEIGQIPENWKIIELNEAVDLAQYGLSVKGDKQGQYPIIRMGNLEDGCILVDDLQYVNLNDETFKNFKLEKGDILFNRTNSIDLVGKTSLFSLDSDFVFASYLIRLKIKGEILPEFVNYYLNWDETQSRLKGLATRAVGQSNISATRLRTLLIPLPSLPEQQTIAKTLNTLDKKIEVEERRKSVLQQLFKTMLSKLMTGEIRVKNLDLGVYDVN